MEEQMHRYVGMVGRHLLNEVQVQKGFWKAVLGREVLTTSKTKN